MCSDTLVEVVCRDQNYTLPPAGLAIPRVTKNLFLEYNQITMLPADMFGNATAGGPSSLTFLQVMFNRIQTIHPNAFRRLITLEGLTLGQNPLREIPAGALAPLTRLTTLGLVSTAMVTLPIFPSLPSLERIFINDNTLTNVTGANFRNIGRKLAYFSARDMHWGAAGVPADLTAFLPALLSLDLSFSTNGSFPDTLLDGCVDTVSSLYLTVSGDVFFCQLSFISSVPSTIVECADEAAGLVFRRSPSESDYSVSHATISAASLIILPPRG